MKEAYFDQTECTKDDLLNCVIERVAAALLSLKHEVWQAAVDAVPEKVLPNGSGPGGLYDSLKEVVRGEQFKAGWNSARTRLIERAREDGVEIK